MVVGQRVRAAQPPLVSWFDKPPEAIRYPAGRGRGPPAPTLWPFESPAAIRSPARPPPEERHDLFGGHGLFEDLRPIGVALAVCGLIPVTFWPTRISFHPLRSTLVYSLLVILAVCWSSWRLAVDRLVVFQSQRRVPLHTRFTSVVSFGCVTGMVLLPLLWLEARHLRQHQRSCAHLMRTLGAAFRSSPRRRARTVSRCAVLCLALFVPVTVSLWLTLIASEGASWTHVLLHNHALAMPLLVSSLVTGSACCVQRVAVVLRVTLLQELSAPLLSGRRVGACRLAWMHLRDATRLLVRTPLALMAMVVHMLLMTTLATYQSLVSVLEGHLGLGLLLVLLGSHYYLLLLMLCDAVHRAVDAVGKDILYPLEMFDRNFVPEAAKAEVNLFREVVSTSNLEVSAAGFWHVSRQTITSILSATVTYVIVLVQFREPENRFSSGEFRNQSVLLNTTAGQPPDLT